MWLNVSCVVAPAHDVFLLRQTHNGLVTKCDQYIPAYSNISHILVHFYLLCNSKEAKQANVPTILGEIRTQDSAHTGPGIIFGRPQYNVI